jgi:nucleoside-diphosphate-sugar epimerase
MKVLITGATGFVGSYLVRALMRRGDSVRVLARSALRSAPLRGAGVEVWLGDLGKPDSLRGIADGVDVIFHLARPSASASSAVYEQIDVEGTEHLLSEAERAGVKRLVYPGTLSAYPLAEHPDGAVIDEHCKFDETGRLGNYARAKARAEAAVLAASARGKIEGVIVRLGLVFGVGTSVLPAHVCQKITRKRVLLFGDGKIPLPLTYIDNAIDALILGATVPGIGGESFNIVDDEVVTQEEYLTELQRIAGGKPQVTRLPVSAYYALGGALQAAAVVRRKEPTTTSYRIRTRLARVRWDCSKAHRMLQWRPRVALRVGLANTFRMYIGSR